MNLLILLNHAHCIQHLYLTCTLYYEYCFSQRQARRIYEILRLKATDCFNKQQFKAYRLDVKKRLNIPFAVWTSTDVLYHTLFVYLIHMFYRSINL